MTDTAQTTSQGAAPVLFEPLSVSVAVAARATGLSEGTIRQLIWDRRLACSRVGRRVLVPLAALKRLVCGSMALT